MVRSLLLAAATIAAALVTAPGAATTAQGVHDFDFLVGKWQVQNRRLKQLFVGGKEWDEFPAVSVARPILDGLGHIDEITMPTKGFGGATLGLFDPKRQEWTVYWISNRDGVLQPPMVGRFADGVGTFYGDDTHNGATVRARYTWSKITPNSAQWEQAYSKDGGKTWETNWVMEFKRAAS